MILFEACFLKKKYFSKPAITFNNINMRNEQKKNPQNFAKYIYKHTIL